MAPNAGWTYTEQIEPGDAGRSVLAHLVASYTHSSANEWTERIRRGEIEVDGVLANVSTLLRPGHTVCWHRPPWEEPDVPMHYELLHEDEAIVAVIKPSGLPTMPAGGFLEHTLLALVRQRFPGASPLHRLGRHTSGLVLFARTHESASLISRAWRDHEVKKQYRALGSGVAVHDCYDIVAPIGRVFHPVLGTVHAASPDGRWAHSVADVIERREGTTLFSVGITTGRPHQIRIHLAYIGHPLAGDPLYGAGGLPTSSPGLPGDGGYLLHSESLRFVHPITELETTLEAPPPPQLLTCEEASARI